jgi:hypothetical protein
MGMTTSPSTIQTEPDLSMPLLRLFYLAIVIDVVVIIKRFFV